MQLSLKAVIAAAAFIVSVNALPTPTSGQGVARRSYPSGGLTCYYTCPIISGFGNYGGQLETMTAYGCFYSNGVYDIECIYDPLSGAYTDVVVEPTNPNVCPMKAIGPSCGTQPNGPQFFKRDKVSANVRKRTAAEEAIQRRQFKPSFAVKQVERTAVEEDEEVVLVDSSLPLPTPVTEVLF